MNLNTKFDLYCWACDFSPNRGEGILARHYIKKLSKIKKKKIHIKSPDGVYIVHNGILKEYKVNRKNLSKLNLNFFENYLNPLLGILYLWTNYLKSRGLCYLNFLPLWNTLLFIFLPPKTHLGPITGFIYNKKIVGFNSFFRRYLNNFLFKININFLFFRQNKIYFSTDLLKHLITNKNKKKVFFNYLLQLVELKKNIKKKNYDFLIYNRNYSVKNNFLRDKILKIIIKMNLKILIIGDKIILKKIKNVGFISRKKVDLLLEKTKFIINSGENPYNIFTIDAFNNHVNIIYENSLTNKVNYLDNKKIFFLDLNNNDKIINFLKQRKKKTIKQSKLNKNYKILNNDSITYFKNIKITYSQ
ncbi:hypothetical protein N8796_00880 [Candidatus Pelagibacter sp.]|nr:hypothetical protein [Candidatus Pelagibacter sp.]